MQNGCADNDEDIKLKPGSPSFQSGVKSITESPAPCPPACDVGAQSNAERVIQPLTHHHPHHHQQHSSHHHQHQQQQHRSQSRGHAKTSAAAGAATTDRHSSDMKPNQVRTVLLNGTPIVALVIDGKERLCLAQISNTLLKTFSYNEIHNRRVALGITCVQCTPVQLEILRRAGAMPISSRRCGMISKREAERLCKSFLTENCPPKLPDNFSFEVIHECAWGCRGSFLPSRYNSSRAKCIKCTYCNLFFSPNKFIFHSHRLPESKYVQPDAANFNSWRRHLKLSGTPMDEVIYAWEDVKAMFNGGSRKRVMAASISRFHDLKRPRPDGSSSGAASSRASIQPPSGGMPSSGISASATTTAAVEHSGRGPPYVSMLSYPPTSGKTSYGLPVDQNSYLSRRAGVGHNGNPVPAMAHCGYDQGPTSSYTSGVIMDSKNVDVNHHVTGRGGGGSAPSFVDYMWAGKQAGHPSLTAPTSYGFMWSSNARQPAAAAAVGPPMSLPAAAAAKMNAPPSDHFYELERNYRDDVDSGSDISSRAEFDRCESSCSEHDFRSSEDNDDVMHPAAVASNCGSGGGRVLANVKDSGFVSSPALVDQGAVVVGGGEKLAMSYCSAFRPVVRVNNSGASLHSVESLIRPASDGGGGGGGGSGGGGDVSGDLIKSDVRCSNSTRPKMGCFNPCGYYDHQKNRNKDQVVDVDEVDDEEDRSSKSTADSDNVIDVEVTDDSKDIVDQQAESMSPKSKDHAADVDDDERPKDVVDEKVAAAGDGDDDDDDETGVCSPSMDVQLASSPAPQPPPPPAMAATTIVALAPLSKKNVAALNAKENSSSAPASVLLQTMGRVVHRQESLTDEANDIHPSMPLNVDEKEPKQLTKDELQEILLQETQARKRAEKQCEVIKESFQEQVKREVAYREEITKQLDIVKETLCNELDQERKARFAVLQKLKEAHDALHHFSCKVLIPRQCSECSYKPLLPQ